jgi:hypothetical protein
VSYALLAGSWAKYHNKFIPKESFYPISIYFTWGGRQDKKLDRRKEKWPVGIVSQNFAALSNDEIGQRSVTGIADQQWNAPL